MILNVMRCVMGMIVCTASASLASATWIDDRLTQPAIAVATSSHAAVDVGDVVATLITAKAGRASSRMSAGLPGDWSAYLQKAQQPFDDLDGGKLASRDTAPGASQSSPSEIADDHSPSVTAGPADIAAGSPLFPALLAGLPAALVAFCMRRAF